jgi:hypothetical protein
MPPIINNVADVIMITTAFPLPVVLCYPLTLVVVSKAVIVACRWCCFTLGSFCSSVWSVVDGGFSLMIASQSFSCYDMVGRISLLLSQGKERWALWCHALDQLYDGLEPHDIEVRIQILDQFVDGC